MTVPATGVTSATLQFVAPMTPDTYTARLFVNAGVWTRAATSNPITVNETTPPVISNVAASSITVSAATITWTTDEGSDSQVDYGLTTAYGSSSALNASLVTSHTVTLSGLAGGTVHHYRVRSRDAAVNPSTSGDFTFTTLVIPDTLPPTVSITAPANGATVSGTTA